MFANVNGGGGVPSSGRSPSSAQGTATLALGGSFSSLFIVKDIQYDVFSTRGPGTATFSVINQTFSQVIPEPASVVMMGLGLVGAIGAVRLRHQARRRLTAAGPPTKLNRGTAPGVETPRGLLVE